MKIRQSILNIIKKESLVYSNIDKLFLFMANTLNVSLETIKKEFDKLLADGDIFEIRKGKFITIPSRNYFKGRFFGSTKGYGFCKVSDEIDDFFIPGDKCLGAIDGDNVIIKVLNSSSEGSDAEVVKVYKQVEKLVGTVVKVSSQYYLEPENPKICFKIPITTKPNKFEIEDVVVVKLTRSEKGNIKCNVVEVLGKQSDVKTLELSIIRQHGLYEAFPKEVLDEVAKIPNHVTPKQKKGRLDLTNERIFTIDGEDSRDFDDAISIKRNEIGYELGVHIADVGEYVKRNSAVDEEALKRGTSVYFPNSVLPMLPEKLSNDICSLKENVERLTLSCIMNIDKNGNVVNYKLCESYIKSVARLTYTEVYDALTKTSFNEKTKMLEEDFIIMRELADILESNTIKRGALDFEIPEAYFIFDENNYVTEVRKRERNIAHKLIEDFMVLANEVVARKFEILGMPFVYRIHEKPKKEKVQDVCAFLKGLGVRYPDIPKDIDPKYFQKLIDTVKDENYADTVNKVILRSMQKARYSNENMGHFGLALEYYCHFTSPIRRYPDLAIHRIIKDSFKKKLTKAKKEELIDFTHESSEQSSLCERNADLAERDVDDLWKAYLMKDKVGDVFDAVITQVREFGFFVELDNTVEGLVKIENLPEDAYLYFEKTMKLKGQKFTFSLGDKLKVQLINVNLNTRKLEFVVVL